MSLSKAGVLLVAALTLLLAPQSQRKSLLWDTLTPRVVLAMLAALAISMLYTVAPLTDAAVDLVKYSKLLLIVVIPFLLSTRRQIWTAMGLVAAAQVFVLLSSCALAAGLSLPWVKEPYLINSNSVFHEYLRQSIMTVAFAGLCWHLRDEWPQRWLRSLLMGLSALALINVLFMLKGRTAYVLAMVIVLTAVLWETRRKWRLVTVLAPVLILLLAVFTSPQLKYRASLVVSEAAAFQPGNKSPSSTGARLNFWYRSAQAIAERPLTGFGAGSWPSQYLRLDAGSDPWYRGAGGNPHQEYLLWGVLLGIGGIALQFALLVALWRDSRHFAPAHAKATRMMILVLATTSLFNSALYDAEVGDFFCLSLGLLFALGRSGTTPASSTPTAAPGSTGASAA